MTTLAPTRTCLHCVLARTLRAESGELRARGLEVRLGPSEPVFLAAPGRHVYRRLRAFFREAAAQAARGRFKLTVLGLPGKSHVEVMASFATGAGDRVLSCAFPFHDPAALGHGFAEHA